MTHNKDCTTCRWEPDWDRYVIGKCKKLPAFIDISLHKEYGPDVWAFGFRGSKEIKVENCNLWEAK